MKKSNVVRSIAVVWLFLCATANAAVVYLGSDVTTGPYWRTSTVAKSATFDPNGDGGYGSDGNYVFYMQNVSGTLTQILSNVPPAYASLSEASGVLKYANPVYGRTDDPTSPIGTGTWTADVGFFYNWAYGPSHVDLLNVTLTSDANFVLGVIAGGSTMTPDALRVLQTAGTETAEASADSSGTPKATGGRQDYYFFQISGMTGDQFVVSGVGSDRDVGINGFTFESIPAPGPVPVYWTGIGNTTWSTATGLNNWKDSGGTAANYADGAPVTFDDTATGTSVDISAADVSPASVTFNNSSQNFTVTGVKGIAGATGVVKQGTGTVTLNCVNTYTGVTTIQAGTLQMSEYAYGNVATNGGADIQAGKGILDYSLSGTSPAPEVQAALTASYHGGAWDTGQIRNTTAASTGLSLGWADDATAKQVTIMATYAGDANLSGTVNVADLTLLLNNYNKTAQVWKDGDFNYDGSVNVADLTALLNQYNKSIGGSVLAASMGSSAVPEPGTLALLAMGLVGLLAYAWRKR
jgi:autotransporter-associated beta strand protein